MVASEDLLLGAVPHAAAPQRHRRCRRPRARTHGRGDPHRAASYYSTLSLWDTFRGVHPLLTLLVPERVPGFVQTMLAHHRAMGYLPLWTAWGRETHTMIGNPALPVIADAVA
jgi:putative alpha-1,2-mannosidase